MDNVSFGLHDNLVALEAKALRRELHKEKHEMRKIAVVLLVGAFANSYAIAGTVDFGPTQEIVLPSGVDVVPAGMQVTFPVSITSETLELITSMRLVFESTDLFLAPPTGPAAVPNIFGGSLNPSQGSGFTADGRIGVFGVATDGLNPIGFLGNFDDGFIDLQGTTSGRGIDFQVANTTTQEKPGPTIRPNLPAILGEPIFIGMLTVDAAGLTEGTYTVEIPMSQRNNVAFGQLGLPFVEEALSGFGTVQVTPEPATLALLGLGGLVALRRRRRTA